MADGNNVTKKRFTPQGPFAPPTPAEADQEGGGKPMAVAGDERTGQDAFKPTTARKDQMARDVAERYRDPQLGSATGGDPGSPTPHGAPVEERGDENRANEKPEGYSETDDDGWRKPES